MGLHVLSLFKKIIGKIRSIVGIAPQSVSPVTPLGSMEEEHFWAIVDESCRAHEPGSEAQFEWIEEKLSKFSQEDIIKFENTRLDLAHKADTFPVLLANFIIQSYISDDVSEDFRAWLISNGKKRFYAAIEDPQTIADFCDAKDPIEEIQGDPFLFTAMNAYIKAGGTEEDYYDLTQALKEAEYETEWPDDEKGFREAMPILFEKFWNLERIKEIHSEEDTDLPNEGVVITLASNRNFNCVVTYVHHESEVLVVVFEHEIGTDILASSVTPRMDELKLPNGDSVKLPGEFQIYEIRGKTMLREKASLSLPILKNYLNHEDSEFTIQSVLKYAIKNSE